jgi:protein-tyrosine phosphatase
MSETILRNLQQRMMLARSLLVSLFAVSIYARADVTNLSCIQTGDTEYKLSYSFTAKTHNVQIFASSSPEPAAPRQLVLKTKHTTVVVHAGNPKQRVYFFLKADSGEVREVSIRSLPLEGATNFRDLGGYQTSDGHFVRWGLLYRSAVLTYLTPADMKYLQQLGIRVVCDFRRKRENEIAPEAWIPGVAVDHLSLPIGDESGRGMETLASDNPSTEQFRARFMASYGESDAFKYAFQYAKAFKEVENDSLPLLYHCTGGKDRTGIFSAFLLLTVGVPEKTILEDYSLTNKYILENMQSDLIAKMQAASGYSISSLPAEQQKIVMAADPAYLEHILRAIDAKYGSFDNYRRQVLKVSDEDALKLQKLLTQ